MIISPVTGKKDEQEFLQVACEIYRRIPAWIRPLDKDILDVFDEGKNKYFRLGTARRWILKNDEGKLIGRIAAFIYKKYRNKGDNMPVGGIGFFECINDQAAADLLFDNARHWLMTNGMEAMDGPINFGERDKWWGLLVEGFHSALYGMNYHPPYYRALFEQYGFKAFYDQFCMGFDPKKPLSEKIHTRHAIVAAQNGFSASHIRKNKLEKYAHEFAEVYNQAWAGHGGLKELSIEQVLLMFKKMKPVMDERIIWFAYYQQKPIAMFINLPDLNQWFKYLNGKFGWIQKLKFLWIKTFVKNSKFTGLAFGVIPEFQGKGVDSYLIGEAGKLIISDDCPYTEYEMQWIGDFNPKMINIASGLGDVHISRKLTTYRYIFDRTKPFERHPIF